MFFSQLGSIINQGHAPTWTIVTRHISLSIKEGSLILILCVMMRFPKPQMPHVMFLIPLKIYPSMSRGALRWFCNA
jgi:hypothetical protein